MKNYIYKFIIIQGVFIAPFLGYSEQPGKGNLLKNNREFVRKDLGFQKISPIIEEKYFQKSLGDADIDKFRKKKPSVPDPMSRGLSPKVIGKRKKIVGKKRLAGKKKGSISPKKEKAKAGLILPDENLIPKEDSRTLAGQKKKTSEPKKNISSQLVGPFWRKETKIPVISNYEKKRENSIAAGINLPEGRDRPIKEFKPKVKSPFSQRIVEKNEPSLRTKSMDTKRAGIKVIPPDPRPASNGKDVQGNLAENNYEGKQGSAEVKNIFPKNLPQDLYEVNPQGRELLSRSESLFEKGGNVNQASSKLSQIKALYKNRKFDKVIKLAISYLRTDKNYAEALFYKSRSLELEQQNPAAIESYLEIARDFSNHRLADDALKSAALLYKREGNIVGAVNLLGEILQRYPNGNKIDAALFHLGQIYEKNPGRQNLFLALKFYREVVNRFGPDKQRYSPYIGRSIRALKRLKRML